LIGVVVLAAVVALIVARPGEDPPPQPAAPAVRIYSSLPVSEGAGLRDLDLAVRMAVAERAGRAGVHRIEHVPLDSASVEIGIPWEVGRVQANARRAAADSRAVAYLGDIFTGASAISAPLLERAGVLTVSPAAGGGTGSRGLVRVLPGEVRQGEALLRWMRRLGTRRLVVLEDGEQSGRAIARAVSRGAGRAGIAVVDRASLDPHRLATVRRAAKRALARRADTMLYTGLWQNRGAVTFNRFHRAAPQMRLMGTELLADRLFTRDLFAGARRRTRLVTTLVPAPSRFARAFERRTGHAPHPLAIYGYESADLVLDTLAELPTAPPMQIRRALRNAVASTRGRAGAAGRYSVGASGGTTLRRVGGLRVTRGGGLRHVGSR